MEYPYNNTYDIFFHSYTTDIFRRKNDTPWIFLEHECIFVGKHHVS